MGIKKLGKKVAKGVKKAATVVKVAVEDVVEVVVDAAEDTWDVVEDIGDGVVHIVNEGGQEFEKFMCGLVGKEPGDGCSVSGGGQVSDDGVIILTDGEGRASEVPEPKDIDQELNLTELWTWSQEQEVQAFKDSGGWVFQGPLDNLFVTSDYGWRKIDGKRSFHDATDYRAAIGSPIKSAGPGYVVFAGSHPKYPKAGIIVTVRYPHFVEVQYMHLSAVSVQLGDRVAGGSQLGLSGKTGTKDPHLHMKVKAFGKTVNPEFIIGKNMGIGTTVIKPTP